MAYSPLQRRRDPAAEALPRESGLQSLIQSHAAIGGALGGEHKQPASYGHYKKNRKFCCTHSHGDFSCGKSLGTRRFQRAVSARDEFIGAIPGHTSPQVWERLILINRFLAETARWKRRVPRACFHFFSVALNDSASFLNLRHAWVVVREHAFRVVQPHPGVQLPQAESFRVHPP